jgi:uncharacterized membrane protein
MRGAGHPIHPAVVAFPIALLACAPICDALDLLGWLDEGNLLAYFCVVAGLIGGVLALITGAFELVRLTQRASQHLNRALTHAGMALLTLGWYVGALVLRGNKLTEPTFTLLGLEIAGALCLGLTGWLGGELVFHDGVRVRDVREP